MHRSNPSVCLHTHPNQAHPHKASEVEMSNKSPDFKDVCVRGRLGCFFLMQPVVNTQKKCVSDVLGTFIPDPISGAAKKMQMTQLPDYLQEDVSTSQALPGQKLRAAFTFLSTT